MVVTHELVLGGNFAGGIWNAFASSFTTKSPTNKWIALADSARQIGLETVLMNFLIVA